MSDITLHWFLPTYGDSRAIMAGGHGGGLHTGPREVDLNYLTQLVLAAEYNGFESVLTPTGAWCADVWITTAALIAKTEKLKFLVALRPGLSSPTLIAQQAHAFQRLSGDRLILNVVVGGEDLEQRAYGDHSTKEERYAKAGEVLDFIDRVWSEGAVGEGGGESIDYHGDYLDIKGAHLTGPVQKRPPYFFGGSSAAGIATAAAHADTYLTWGEPVQQVGEKLASVDAAALAQGRAVEHGVRLHVIARPTEEEAWAEAQKLLDGIDPEAVRAVQNGLARSQSEGQRRMAELHGRGSDFTAGADARSLEIAPNLWAGVGLVRGGAGTALVGSYDQVAERLAEYRAVGASHFILSGYPHLEETFHVGEGIVPALQRLGLSVANHSSPEELDSESVHYSTPFADASAS